MSEPVQTTPARPSLLERVGLRRDHHRRTSFGGLEIVFDDGVLVPRSWTLAQSVWAQGLLRSAPDGPVLELCAGAGHIGLAAVLGTGRKIVQVDQDAAACDFARTNAATAVIESDVRCGTLERSLHADERFVLVLADPPWVPSGRVAQFPDDPVAAIDGGVDGLDLARECLRVAAAHLAPGGHLLLQLGNLEQVTALRPDVAAHGLLHVDARSYGAGVVVCLSRA